MKAAVKREPTQLKADFQVAQRAANCRLKGRPRLSAPLCWRIGAPLHTACVDANWWSWW